MKVCCLLRRRDRLVSSWDSAVFRSVWVSARREAMELGSGLVEGWGNTWGNAWSKVS